MFLSALIVVMGPPPAGFVRDYFADFHATAVHTWMTGLPGEIEGWVDGGAAMDGGVGVDGGAPSVPWVSWLQNGGSSAANGQLLGGIAPPPGRIGYQIGDEPSDLADAQAMVAGVNAVLAADPSALTILNFSIGNPNSPAVLAYAQGVPEIDVFSMDNYTYGNRAYLEVARLRDAAVAGGKVWWRYTDAYHNAGAIDLTGESDLRWDAYLGATYGYTGLTWFIYQIVSTEPKLRSIFFTDVGDFSSARTQKFAWAAAINLEMLNLGRSLALLRSTDVRFVPALGSLGLPSGTVAWAPGAGNDPYLAGIAAVGAVRDAIVGHFRDDCDEPYLLVQSAAHQSADLPNTSTADTTFRLTFNFTGATDPTLDRTAVLVLDPVTGTISPRSLTASSTLDLTLRAGAGVLLKYKTSRPFARQ